MEEVTTDKMFDDSSTVDATEQIRELAEHIAVEMDAVDQLKKEHARRKDELDAAKAKLCETLKEAGMDSCKLECGLNPKAKINRKFFKVEGVDDTMLHDWLRENDLGDVIIPYVHFQTLQSTLRTHEDGGNELPEKIFNISLQPTITMYGKAKYLAERNGS